MIENLLGEKIRMLREEAPMTQAVLANELVISDAGKATAIRMTQAVLANELGLSRLSIGNYEKGDRTPDIATIIKMATLFQCSTDYLLGLSEAKNPLEKDKNDDISQILERIEIIIRNSRSYAKEEFTKSLAGFEEALSIAETPYSKLELIRRPGPNTYSARIDKDDNEIPGTRHYETEKYFDFTPVTSREKQIRSKLNTISETLQERVRDRGFVALNAAGYKIQEDREE